MKYLRNFYRFFLNPIDRVLNYLAKPLPGKNESRYDFFSRWVTVSFLCLAVIVFVITPFKALSWNRVPFPGFLLEQTLVINSVGGEGWLGRLTGIDYPQKLVDINSRKVYSTKEFLGLLASAQIGQNIDLTTQTPDGTQFKYTDLELQVFPGNDLMRLFWLPYGIGLIFLVLAIWVFRLRGRERPGLAFTYTTATGAISIGLIFDLSTSHLMPALWTISIAQVGGALINLALLFPEEYKPVNYRARIRLIAHGISILLAVWGLILRNNNRNPWAYVIPWRYSYFYAGFGFIFFLGVLFYRLRFYSNPVAYQQARIIVWGSLAAFLPLAIWFAIQIFYPVPFSPTLLLPTLIIFPLVVGISILRYHMWDIDIIINRTLVYLSLTLLLGLIYIVSVLALEYITRPWMQGNLTATVISTLLIAALFTPLRRWIQEAIDRHFFRKRYDAQKILEKFAAFSRNETDMDQLTQGLLMVVAETMQAENISLWLKPSTDKPVLLMDRNQQPENSEKINQTIFS